MNDTIFFACFYVNIYVLLLENTGKKGNNPLFIL